MSKSYLPDAKKSSATKPTEVSFGPSNRKTLLRLLSYLKTYWWALLLTVLGFAINASGKYYGGKGCPSGTTVLMFRFKKPSFPATSITRTND